MSMTIFSTLTSIALAAVIFGLSFLLVKALEDWAARAMDYLRDIRRMLCECRDALARLADKN